MEDKEEPFLCTAPVVFVDIGVKVVVPSFAALLADSP